jgi:hypothetical protein
MDSFGLLGFAHLFAAVVLGLAGSDPVLVWSQFIGGVLEVSYAVYIYQS